ncbi:MAG: MBL fold metallo-hydrolase [Clostridia bacterium]|nr:MBL fold metallo-hydrolase [Clostridia bacterium]
MKKHTRRANRKKIMMSILTVAGAIFLTSCTPGSGKNDPKPVVTKAPDNTGCVELYQLAPDPNSLMMSYVIVTPNRKVIVIDGGIDGYGMNEPPYLPSAIRAILGLGEGEYFEVEAWFLSHGHWDHFYELAKMMASYKAKSNYKVNNFYFDFPDYGVEWTTPNTGDYNLKELKVLKRGLDRYYAAVGFNGIKGADIPEELWTKPDDYEGESYYYDLINAAVINKESVKEGLTIGIDGVDFQVLCTWNKSCANVNSTSVVLRMVYKEHSVLFLGDAYVDTGNGLLRRYSDDELRSEYVQMAHHGQSGTDEKFYTRIGAAESKRLWPSPVWVWQVYNSDNGIRTDVTRSWLGLPADFNEFAKQGLLNKGNDFVAGLYIAYPADPDSVEGWTDEVLDAQRVAIFD